MLQKIIHSKAGLILLACIVPFLAISIFISDLIFSILALLFLVYLIKNVNLLFSLLKKNFFLLILFFYLTLIISSLLSENVLFSLKSSIFFIRAILFVALISYLIEQKPEIEDIFYKFLIVTFLVVTLYGFFEYINKYYYLLNSNQLDVVPIRLMLFVTSEEKLGSFLVRFYGFLFALYLKRVNKTKLANFVFYLLSILVFTIILLSGERTSLFFLILYIFFCFILLDIKLKIKIIGLTIIITLFFLLLTFNYNLKNRIILDSNNKINITNPDKVVIFTPQHTEHYKIAFKMFIEKPFLGHGPNMFRIICKQQVFSKNGLGCSTHPHNTFLQLLAETGLLGSLFMILSLFFVMGTLIKHFFVKIIKSKNYLSNYKVALSLTIMITLWPLSPSGNFFNNWILIVYSLPLAFYINEFFFKKY